jgi:stage II sporulation protein D
MKFSHFLLLGSLILAGCATEPFTSNPVSSTLPPPSQGNLIQPKERGPQIRVAIAVRQDSVQLVTADTFTLTGFPSSTPSVRIGQKEFQKLTLTSDQLHGPEAYVQPQGNGPIEVNGKAFKGSLRILTDRSGRLTVINLLPLEDYIMGVLAGEIPRDWPLEALKAQAIAARTFAVLTMGTARSKSEPYDLENTALFQMYQGSGLVNEKIQRAVWETRGRIMTFNSKPILAFYHSNCGGETSGAKAVWSQDEPYLKPVPCSFGNNGAHFRWHAEISIQVLVRKLRAAGLKIGDVVQLKPLELDESNRILKLSIMDPDGTSLAIKGSNFRMAVGPDIIRSTQFTAEVLQDKVVFNGKGWGHGVGLCQEGACGMALKGYGAFDILRYYYHGIMVENIKNIKQNYLEMP